MRCSMTLALLFLFAAMTVGSAGSAVAAEPVPPHQSFPLESATLKETRRINVYTPPGYDSARSTRYPVLYMPDGGLQEVGLSEAERAQNVAGAFTASASVAGRECLLVDDVLTTGATVRAAATALREAGATRVEVITLARAFSLA